MAEASLSVQWRVKGNTYFKSVSDNLGISITIKVSRYQNALNCYERALSLTTADDEVSSAAKNYGVTSWKLGQLACDTNEKWLVIKRYYRNALRHFYIAYIRGSGNKTEEWRDNVLANLRGCWEDVSSSGKDDSSEIDQVDRIITIRECIDYIPCPEMKADCFIELAEFHFHRGVTAIATGDYKVCLTNMRDCYFPLAEAIKYGHSIDKIRREHATMETDVITHTAVAESTQSREIGDNLLNSVLLEEENVDMIWEVIDWYKDSILKVRDLDTRLEAIALSRIGVVYDEVFKIKFKAKIYFHKAVELAHTLPPLAFTNEDWYKKATEALSRYQKETVQHEQEEEAKAKAEVLKKLKPKLDELDKHSDDEAIDFLKFVYKKYPRKNPAHKLGKYKGEITFDQKYKMLQKAVIHFHPDRVNADDEGLEAKILSEEITKRLTARYENIKTQK